MKSIIASVVTCIVLFGISMGATQYLVDSQPAEELQESESPDQPQDGDPEAEAGQSKIPIQLPTALRPDQAVSIETVLQMSDSIRKMEQELISREKRVETEERRIQILYGDLETEQEELRSFSEGIDAKVEMLARMTSTLQDKLDELDIQKQELEQLAKQTGTDTESKQAEFDSRVKEVKEWFENLAPEQAADYLREFANSGKIEFASSLLREMQARQQSKILTAMNDPILVDQLIDALKIPSKNGGN